MIDYGGICLEQLDMMLNHAMDHYGLNAEIVTPNVFDNEYGEVGYPEVEFPKEADGDAIEPSVSTRVLLSKPVDGLLMEENFISYADKIETQYKITCKDRLQREQELRIEFPDGRLMTLRVIEVRVMHPFTSVWYNSIGIVQ